MNAAKISSDAPGPDIGGAYAPYVQSGRMDIYDKSVKTLLKVTFCVHKFLSCLDTKL